MSAFLAALQGWQADIWTAVPAYAIDRGDGVPSFDPNACTVWCQATTRVRFQMQDGSFQWLAIPPLLDCPVQFPSGGGLALTFPIKAGDEGLVVFSSRCIDAWHQSSGVQDQAELRMHSLSDGFFIPGVFSLPKVMPAISTTEAQLRSRDGAAFFALNPSTGAARIVAPGGLEIVADIEHTGSQSTSGDVVASGISLNSHVHGGVKTGTDQTGEPE